MQEDFVTYSGQCRSKHVWTFWLITSVLAALGSSFVFGYNVGVLNTPELVVKQWLNYTLQQGDDGNSSATDSELSNHWAIIVSLFPLGGLVGGLISGWIAEKLGSRNALLLNDILSLLATVLMAIAKEFNNYFPLMVGRFVIGVSAGITAAVCPMYLTEISPVSVRGILGTSNQLTITIAILVSQILGLRQLLGTADLWPLLLALNAVPCIVEALVLPFCPESPVFLVTKGQNGKADSALKKLRNTDNAADELSTLEETVKTLKEMDEINYLSLLTNKLLRWTLFVAVTMMFSQQFSGINGVLFYSTELFHRGVGLSEEAAQYSTLGIGAIFVLSTVASTALIDRVGRRTLHMTGLGGTCICSLLLALSMILQANSVKWAGYVSVLFVITFVLFFGIGPGSIPWFLVHELFLPNARAKANSVAVFWNWVAAYIVGQSFPPLMAALQQYTFFVFTTSLAFFWLFTYRYLPETKNKPVEEVVWEIKEFLRSR